MPRAEVLNEAYDKLVDHVGREVFEGRMKLHRAWAIVLRMAGAPETTPDRMFQEAFRQRSSRSGANTSADLANLLSNVQDKALMKGYREAKPTWPAWTKTGSLDNFQLAKRVQLNDTAQLRETGENGEILDSKLADRAENIQLAYYARSISFTEQMFINDDLDALRSLPQRLGRSAAQLPSRLVYAHLLANGNMSDGNALFDAAHGNYSEGADTALAYTSLESAVAKFRKQTAPQAPNDTEFPPEPIDIRPRYLLVPPELEATACRLLGVPLAWKDGSEYTEISSLSFARSLGLIPLAEARLSQSGYSGASSAAWYLIGDPSDVDTVEVAFLGGRQEPSTMAYADFSSLTIRYRAVLAVGVKALDWRGIVKFKGEV